MKISTLCICVHVRQFWISNNHLLSICNLICANIQGVYTFTVLYHELRGSKEVSFKKPVLMLKKICTQILFKTMPKVLISSKISLVSVALMYTKLRETEFWISTVQLICNRNALKISLFYLMDPSPLSSQLSSSIFLSRYIYLPCKSVYNLYTLQCILSFLQSSYPNLKKLSPSLFVCLSASTCFPFSSKLLFIVFDSVK